MAVRGFVKSLVLRSVEPTVRSWMDAVRQDNAAAMASLRAELAEKKANEGTPPDAAALSELKEEVAQLKKKLSMAMGAMQAASAQIEQLRKDLAAAQNLAQQAMQKAVTAQSTAEAATEGVTALESANGAGHVRVSEGAAPVPAPVPQGGGKRQRAKKA